MKHCVTYVFDKKTRAFFTKSKNFELFILLITQYWTSKLDKA